MKRTIAIDILFLLIMVVSGVWISGCSKKAVVAPVPATPSQPATEEAPLPAPTIEISASPSAIERGKSTTLSWRTEHATSVEIDGGIGTVGTSGNRMIAPTTSITYTAAAAGPGGKASASTRVTVVEPEEAAPSSPSVLTVGEFFSMRVLDVFFDFDKYDLHDDSVATLDRNAVSLKERPEIFFLIEGHCDERGSEAYNLALGDKRAQAARQYLISKGISADRIDTISYGEERPFASGQTESAWGQNRRAHFVLRKPSATISDGLSGSWIQR